MKRWFARYKQCLALSRWPIISPEEILLKEQREKLNRLYGK
jgi:hypothetical protein